MEWPDLADQVLVATRDTFGESVTYAHGGDTPFSVVAVFDLAPVLVDLSTGALQRSSEPRLGVRLADFAVAPAVGDIVTRADGSRWKVADVAPDGQGGADLKLRKL